MLFNRVHVHSTVIALEFFHLSKFYLDEKTPLLKQFFSYFNCRFLNNNGLMHKYLLCWPGRQRSAKNISQQKGSAAQKVWEPLFYSIDVKTIVDPKNKKR